jgi:hypothetical protein
VLTYSYWRDWVKKEPNIGSAILGMYAAIKIARAYGIKWQELGKMIEPVVIENEEFQRDGDSSRSSNG